SLRDSLILSLLTLPSASDTTVAKQVKEACRRIRTTKSLTSAYSVWRRTCIELGSQTAGSFGFLVQLGTSELRLHSVRLDGPLTRCLSFGLGPLDVAIRRDQTGILHADTT